ncbi:MAG: response regulator transcription factor [Actinomycetota bacterium]
MIRVLIVDDHSVVRRGLEQMLATADGLEVVGSAANGEEAVLQAAALAPDIVLMDLSMPVLDGIAATRAVLADAAAADREMRVVVLTSFTEQRRVLDALQAGASGYILKDSTPDEVIKAVHAAHAGGAPLDPVAARVLLDARRVQQPAQDLSPRESEVLALVATGLANKQIARRLGISERTVKAHLTAVFQQLGVTDRTQAALWAKEHLPAAND